MITESLLKKVESGRVGDNWGLDSGMPNLERYTDGVSQSTYTVIFGGSGTGKTSFALYSYIYKPLMDSTIDDFQVIYYSLEMPADILFGKLLGMYIFEKYGIEISVKEMLSKKRNEVLSDELYEIILDGSNWLKEIEPRFVVYDKAVNAAVVQKHLKAELAKCGKFEETDNRVIYHPNNPKKITLVVFDHAGLTTNTNGRSLKEEIDLVSKVLVKFRNDCAISPLMIAQMNRDSASMERKKNDLEEPRRSDIKDSGNIEQDAEIIIAIYDPARDKRSEYRKYDASALSRILRGILLLKNRYGDGDIFVASSFYGKCGIWRELPKAEEIVDYEQFLSVDWKKSVKKQIDKIEKIQDKNICNLTL